MKSCNKKEPSLKIKRCSINQALKEYLRLEEVTFQRSKYQTRNNINTKKVFIVKL